MSLLFRKKLVPGTDDLAKGTNYLVFATVLSYLVLQLVFEFILGREWIETYIYLFLAFIQFMVILMPALLFAGIRKMSFVSVFRIRSITVHEILLIIPMTVLSGIIASVLNSLLICLLGNDYSVPTGGVPVPGNISELLVQIAVVALIPSICEEIFFRGVIYHSISGMGATKAIIVSSLYFSLFHFDIRNLLGPFFLGILIAWYCYRTGSIFAGIIAHFTNNSMFVLINWFNRNIENEPLNLTPGIIKNLVSFSLLIGVILFILIRVFSALTGKKAAITDGDDRKSSLSIIFHWPMCIFYFIYIAIVVLSIDK